MLRAKAKAVSVLPPEKVFEYFMDPMSRTLANPFIKRVEVITPGPIALGSRWRCYGAGSNIHPLSETELLGVEPGKSITFVFFMDGMRHQNTLSVIPHGAGSEVTYTATCEGTSFLMKLAVPLGYLGLVVGTKFDAKLAVKAAEIRAAAHGFSPGT